MSEIAVRRQGVSERRQVLREIAKERAKTESKDLSQPSIEEDKGQQQETEGGMPFEQISPEQLILEGRMDVGDSFSWTQFAPWGREKKKRVKPMNTATIWLMARKEIAREWREARGTKPKRNPAIDLLEREAAMWGEKQEEKRTRQEEARAEFEQQKVKVDEVLKIIGQKILEEKDNLTTEKAMGLIEDAFGAAGKVYDVEWREDGCDICFEPWEERWPRQRGGEAPLIHRIRVDDKLEMVSYDLVEDDERGQKVKEVMLTNQLKESADEEPLAVDEDEEDIKIRIEKKIEKVGRLIELKKLKERTWLATVELWEAMKIRNVERKGEGPIETESILAKVVDGAIITTPIKGKKPLEKKEESKSELGAAQQK